MSNENNPTQKIDAQLAAMPPAEITDGMPAAIAEGWGETTMYKAGHDIGEKALAGANVHVGPVFEEPAQPFVRQDPVDSHRVKRPQVVYGAQSHTQKK